MQAAACRDRADQGLQLRGRGAVDQVGHQCCSAIQGESQARIARSARGQDGGGGTAVSEPPLSAAGAGLRCHVMLRRVFGEPGGPAK